MTNLDLRVKRPLRPIPESEWGWPTEASAISAMVKNGGLAEKVIAAAIEVDGATFSKAQSGSARLSETHMDKLMDVTGSEAWLFYWLLKRGYDPRSLRRRESELERKVRELEEKLAVVEHDREVEMRLYQKLRTA